MTNDEIKLLLQSTPLKARNKLEWIKAFEEYNQDHPNDRPLQMNCVPCYSKVFIYIIKKYNVTTC